MQNDVLVVQQSPALSGTATLFGAKNAVLVIMASLILTRGKSVLHNVPASEDVKHMLQLLSQLGAQVAFDTDAHTATIDTTSVSGWAVNPQLMKKMRASVLVMGPLLARFGHVALAMPGGCVIGARPIDLHLKNFAKMGVNVTFADETLHASVTTVTSERIVLEYPSVGATENILMLAVMTPGTTTIVNAALEPEVYDLIDILTKMGARIELGHHATIVVTGVRELNPVVHEIIPDRLEAGSLLLAAAITGGQLYLPQARADHMDLFLLKLQEMGHTIIRGPEQVGVRLIATKNPTAVSFKTMPYPGFPTDLQACMMAAQVVAQGTCVIEETVFENRLLHVPELQKMGASIRLDTNKAQCTGVTHLQGTHVVASDIRASCALVLAGLVANGTTTIAGVHHWKRGYDGLEHKLRALGARIECVSTNSIPSEQQPIHTL